MQVSVGLLFLAALIGLVVAGTPASSAGASKVGGRFVLLNHHGHAVSDASFQGRYLLVTFGYTYCPDICPTILATLAQVIDDLGDQAEQLVPLFISVDPKRDTVEQMADYVTNFHPRLVGLTGSDAMIKRLTEGYRVRFRHVPDPDGDPQAYTIDHSGAIFLMGQDGEFLAKFLPGVAPDVIVEQIERNLGGG